MSTHRWLPITGVVVLLASFAWAYWPTLTEMASTWETEADYSHGYFVAPIALYFLWARRELRPPMALGFHWPGLALLALAFAVRFISAYYFIPDLDAWSIVVWFGGATWLIAGRRVALWAAPAIIFLGFMAPLPYSLERGLSRPLQAIATSASCWVLQLLGQPALAEGNTIVMGDRMLFVEEACSGLRIFMGIIALAYAFVVLSWRRPLLERAVLLLSALPIAIIANFSRIVGVAFTDTYLLAGLQGEAFREAHEVVDVRLGYVMILLAAGLFGLVLAYCSAVFKQVAVPHRPVPGRRRVPATA